MGLSTRKFLKFEIYKVNECQSVLVSIHPMSTQWVKHTSHSHVHSLTQLISNSNSIQSTFPFLGRLRDKKKFQKLLMHQNKKVQFDYHSLNLKHHAKIGWDQVRWNVLLKDLQHWGILTVKQNRKHSKRQQENDNQQKDKFYMLYHLG